MERLTSTLSSLSHLNLEGQIVRKQPLQAGLGGTCDVFTAWSERHGRKVAVKQIRVFMRKDTTVAKKLAKEIGIWAKLDHECVLPLLGYLVEGDDLIPSLVSEWQEHGTLNDFMIKFPRGGEDTWNMLSWIASGLEYLHAQGVIHADLKSHNILISQKYTPLLADFGLSTAISQTMMATATCTTNGTVRWMAIELMDSSNGDQPTHTKETDVWAFGMVALELLSGNIPYSYIKSDYQVIPAIIKGTLPTKPENDHHLDRFDVLWSMCQTCWDRDPIERPTAVELCAFLSEDPTLSSVAPSTNEWDDQRPNVLDCVRSESPIDMSTDFSDSEDDGEAVVPLPYAGFVRDLKIARRLSSPIGSNVSKPKGPGSPIRATFPQRKASMQASDNRRMDDRIQRNTNMRLETGQRSPTLLDPTSRSPRARPSKTADGQIFVYVLDNDDILSSPGRRRKLSGTWSLYNASLTNSHLRIKTLDNTATKQNLQLRDAGDRLMYKVKIQPQTSMPVEGGSNPRRIYPFALVNTSSSKTGSRLAAVSEEERNMWVGAFAEVAGVQVQL